MTRSVTPSSRIGRQPNFAGIMRVICLCLVFSGLTALVYQIVWTRLLGFAFGTTSEAIGTVLAIFFGGLALGNGIAARLAARVRRPLLAYAWLELAIGIFALLSLPLLRRLPALHGVGGLEAVDPALLRFGVASLVLLPPTVAMGATLPVVARGLVRDDATLGRASALLYAANTLGAVLGAYLCGFWWIPRLGLTRSVVGAALLNLAVAAVVLGAGRGRTAAAEPAGAPGPRPARSGTVLALFAVSGFVAIGYEIAWSRAFAIVMEGTLYGFAAVLSAYLLGIGLGSLAAAPFVDRIRDLPRAFALLHLGIAASVVLGTLAVPYLPFLHRQLAGDSLHVLFLLVAPIVLVPTALFGAAFPVLLRLYTRRAEAVGRGIGLATAVNTAGSIAASLLVGFWWIPAIGMDASIYALVLLDLGVALFVLLRFQAAGSRAERWRRLAPATALVLLVALGFDGVHVDRAVAGRQNRARDLTSYRRELARRAQAQVLRIEGRSALVTLERHPDSLVLRSNGLPEAGLSFGPPHFPLEAVLLGLLPYLAAEADPPGRALVIGLGGGNTLTALARTAIGRIDVVELEPAVARAVELLHRGRANPLDDPRVRLRTGDGRNELLLRARRGAPGYDLIASQPSHPWRVGAANLFTEEFFALARANLSDAGCFALWVNGFRSDEETLLAIVASFERVFPGALLFDVGIASARNAFLLLGARRPVVLDLPALARRLGEPGVRALLADYDLHAPRDLLARLEGPAALFAALAPEASNTDDNAYVETRIPRLRDPRLDFAAIEARLAPGAPLLPPVRGNVDRVALARAMLDAHAGAPRWPYAAKLARLLGGGAGEFDPVLRETLLAEAKLRAGRDVAGAVARLRALAARAPDRPEPLRALGRHLDPARAAEAFAEAHARSGSARDAFEVGHARFAGEPERAWRGVERIPDAERNAFPALAWYAAARVLAERASPPALRAAYADLLRYRDTEEGRTHAGTDELLARLAFALGDEPAARAFSDAAQRERRRAAAAPLRRAEAALAAGRLGEARAALSQAAGRVPAEASLHRMRARLALAREDPVALEDALRALRRFAPSPAAGLARENGFRIEHGLPLRLSHARDG